MPPGWSVALLLNVIAPVGERLASMVSGLLVVTVPAGTGTVPPDQTVGSLQFPLVTVVWPEHRKMANMSAHERKILFFIKILDWIIGRVRINQTSVYYRVLKIMYTNYFFNCPILGMKHC